MTEHITSSLDRTVYHIIRCYPNLLEYVAAEASALGDSAESHHSEGSKSYHVKTLQLICDVQDYRYHVFGLLMQRLPAPHNQPGAGLRGLTYSETTRPSPVQVWKLCSTRCGLRDITEDWQPQ